MTMVWPFFRRKKENAFPAVLPSKNGAAFFEYQCKFGETTIEPKKGIVALVLDARQELGAADAVMIERDERQVAMLKVASSDGGFVVRARTPSANGESLRPGDAVVWVPMEYASPATENVGNTDPRSWWVGLIVAKVAPEIGTAGSELKIIAHFD